MPRKQNGFGNAQSLAFKGAGRVDRGKGVGAVGLYPSNRSYGASVNRSVIEKWNLESDWVKWRKGFEIYNRTAWSELKVANPLLNPADPLYDSNAVISKDNPEYVVARLVSLLYQGTPYEIPTEFVGYEYPTSNSDVNTHYVAKRTPAFTPLGVVTSVQNDATLYPENKLNREIYVQGIPDITNGRLLLQMIGERLADGGPRTADDDTKRTYTEATLKNVLTEEKLPGVYLGKTAPKDVQDNTEEDLLPTTVQVRIPIVDVKKVKNPALFTPNQGLFSNPIPVPASIDYIADPNQLIGKLIYIPNFFIEKPIADLDALVWAENENYIAATIVETEINQQLFALDPGVTQLPPALYDIAELPKIFETDNATYTVQGTYVFKKSDYQRYYGRNYFASELMENQVTDLSYTILPFAIQSADIINGFLTINSEPFNSEIKMTPALTINSYLVFSDNSFCQYTVDPDSKWTDLNTDINPWMDEVFTSGEQVRPANTYTCSCPNHAQAILAMPEATESASKRKINRQRRYPLPTVKSQDRYVGAGVDQAAGKITSWESLEHRLSFKMCKHTIATMFNEGIRVQEPNKYPTQEARDAFEQKLIDDVNQSALDFEASYKRGGLSLTEIVFALAQGLNLDNTETAYVVLNSN